MAEQPFDSFELPEALFRYISQTLGKGSLSVYAFRAYVGHRLRSGRRL